MKTNVFTRTTAERQGFAGFNSGQHLCVELDDGPTSYLNAIENVLALVKDGAA